MCVLLRMPGELWCFGDRALPGHGVGVVGENIAWCWETGMGARVIPPPMSSYAWAGLLILVPQFPTNK